MPIPIESRDKYEPDPAVQSTNELIEQEKVLFLCDYVGTPTLTVQFLI